MFFCLMRRVFLSATLILCGSSATALAGAAPAIASGFNLNAAATTFGVPFQTSSNSYQVDVNLVFAPQTGPMIKNFQSPTSANGAPIVLTATQPVPFPVNENFFLVVGITPITPVQDWHEIILTPGWQWILPGDPSFPSLFPQGTSLITRDSQPWASTIIPSVNPAELNVKFAPITNDHVLDIHKALLFVGTANNRVWGDEQGESIIQVREYPTPEPSTWVLAVIGAAALLARKRWRR